MMQKYVSNDVLAFTIEIPGRYPSVNHTHADGFRGGKKSQEYRDLKRAVRAAAHAEMKRVGWSAPACWYVAIELTRVVPDRRRRDAMNMGKAELDALRPAVPRDDDYNPADPFPGLYEDDDLALVIPRIELQLGGVDRLIITARRCYPPLHEAPQEKAQKAARHRPVRSADKARPAEKRRRQKPSETAEPVGFVGEIPDGFALCDGRLIPLKEALRQIRRGSTRRGF
jgi:hypothetical protein